MVDILVAGIGFFVLIALLVTIKVVMDAQAIMSSGVRRVEERLVSLEKAAEGVNSQVSGLKSTLDDKVDKSYVEKRLDGLLGLVKKKK